MLCFQPDVFVLRQWCVEIKVLLSNVMVFSPRVKIMLLINKFTVSKLDVIVPQS